MKKILTLFLLSYSICFGQGTMVNDSFYSNLLKEFRFLNIYLPENYNADDSFKLYPVVYYLHASLSDQNSRVAIIKDVVDNLVQNNIIDPMIVVIPNCNLGPFTSKVPWVDTDYTNSELYGPYEDFISDELIEVINSKYNTYSSREKCSIIGFSTGGYGALKIGLKNPSKYMVIASMDGYVSVTSVLYSDWWLDEIKSENNGKDSFDPSNGVWTKFMFIDAGAFSPNLNNPPYYVDLPIDKNFTLIDSVITKWESHNIKYLATHFSREFKLDIYLDSGTPGESDYYSNSELMDTLDVLNIPYTFYQFDGAHTEKLNERFAKAFIFIDSVMQNKSSSAIYYYKNISNNFRLDQNYPNPFNPSTTIKYSIPKQCKITIKVFDVLGSEVITLVNKEQSQGNYEVEFNGTELTSGIYFCRLQAGDFVETKKMILLK